MRITVLVNFLLQSIRARTKPDKTFSFIPSILRKEQCKSLRNEIDELIMDGKYKKHSNNADKRMFGFTSNKHGSDLVLIGQAFCPENYWLAFILANRVEAKDGNLGSGEGWHRDSWFGQRKLIIYLSDVDNDNGPTQVINRSQNFFHKFFSVLRGYTDRLSNDDVIKFSSNNLITVCACEGDAIFFDPSCIHRGKPLINHNRYALTFYYFDSGYDKTEVFKKFSIND